MKYIKKIIPRLFKGAFCVFNRQGKWIWCIKAVVKVMIFNNINKWCSLPSE